MAQKVIRIRLKTKFSYEDFLKDLALEDFISNKLLSVTDLLQIARMRSSCLDHLVNLILNTTLLVCRECSNIFANRIPIAKFVGFFLKTRPALELD